MKYSIGQEVVIVDDGKSYPTYFDWITDNKLCLTDEKVRELWSKYLATRHNDCETGTKLTVVATGHSRWSHAAMYLCEDSNGNPVLIGENGLDTLEKEDAKMLNQIAELEKQIAELKSIADFQTSSNMDRYFRLKRSREQLAKAKKIIKNLMKFAEIDSREYEEEYKEAEQFLEEVSE